MKIRRFLQRLRDGIVDDHRQASYAQCGEDLILQFLLGILGIARPTYLDIGAHHPTRLSNTYLFYKNGSRGVCIEPNPELHAAIQRARPNDVCLNIGIGIGDARPLRFYVLDDPTLSTFSPETVREQAAKGVRVTREMDIAQEPVGGIINKYLHPHPNLVSLDTEGFDLAILESWDFDKYRPEAFCVETLTNVGERKIDAILQLMTARNYKVFADTYINTIFVEGTRWKARQDLLARI